MYILTKEQLEELLKLLPSLRELEVLDNSILAADPTKQDILIKDLRKQINKTTKKIRNARAKLAELPVSEIDWEGLERGFYDECCSRNLLWKGTPATNINTKGIINWLKTNLPNYLKK